MKLRIVQWHEDAAQLYFVQRKVNRCWETFACGNEAAAMEIYAREYDKQLMKENNAI
jgi:hypothetical protein